VSQERIVILPAKNCRRSRKMIEYLESRGIPFARIELESAEGRALAEQHQMRASPGILIEGASINPLDLLIQGECRVDEHAARRVFEDPGAFA
jgi:glutaredoxin